MDTADGENRRLNRRRMGLEARRQWRYTDEGLEIRLLQELARMGGDADGDVLDALGSFLGGDVDDLDHRFLFVALRSATRR